MARRKIKRVGVMLPMNEAYARNVLMGILRYMRLQGSWVPSLYYGDPGDPLKNLRAWGGDGIIAQVSIAARRDAVLSSGITAVNVSSTLSDIPLPQVINDDEAIGRLGAEHFLQRGFRTYAFYSVSHQAFSQVRQKGFSSRLQENGFPCIAHRTPDDFTWEQVLVDLDQWLKDLPRPVAVMASNDISARRVVTACRRLGLEVPSDVAVLGVDNDEIQCELSDIPLSSIRTDTHRIGYEAAELLDKLMSGRKAPRGPVLIPPLGVITRLSTDTLAVIDPEVAKALRFIRDHADRPLSVSDVVEELSTSRRSLERRFREAFGKSPYQEIRLAHIRHAQMLLAETDLPMDKIALRCGFKDANIFSITFRKVTGHSPSKHRRNLRS